MVTRSKLTILKVIKFANSNLEEERDFSRENLTRRNLFLRTVGEMKCARGKKKKTGNNFIPQGSVWVTFVITQRQTCPNCPKKLGTDEKFVTARKKNVTNLSENENCKERKETIIS